MQWLVPQLYQWFIGIMLIYPFEIFVNFFNKFQLYLQHPQHNYYPKSRYADSGTVLVIQCVARAKRACCIPIAEVYERGKKPSSIDKIIM